MQFRHGLVLLTFITVLVFVLMLNAEEVPVALDAVAFLQMKIKPTDPGISWLYHHWTTTPRPSSIREIVAKQAPISGMVALYPEPVANKTQYIALLAFSESVENNHEFTTFIGKKLQTEIGEGAPFIKYSQAGTAVLFATNTVSKKGIGYAFSANQAMIGNNLTNLQKTIQVLKGKLAGITTQPDYIQIKGVGTMNPDIVVYCNNNQQQFTRFLSAREKKWNMSLLLSAKVLRCMLIELDVVDADKLQGMMIFKAANPKAIPDIADDAGFLGEAIRRKFVAQKIKWKSRVTTSGDYIILPFEVTGLKPLWLDLFKSGGLSTVK
jgi:hypothetical protein